MYKPAFCKDVVPIVTVGKSKCLLYRVVNSSNFPLVQYGFVISAGQLDFASTIQSETILYSSALKVEGELWVTSSLPLTVVRVDASPAEGVGIRWVIPDEVIDYEGGMSLELRSFIDTSSILLSDGNEFLEPPKLGYVKHHHRVPILTNQSDLGVGDAVYPSLSNEQALITCISLLR